MDRFACMQHGWSSPAERLLTVVCSSSISSSKSGKKKKKTITHQLLIFFLRIHYTCLQPRGQTKTPVPHSTGHFIKKKKRKKSATKQIFHQATLKQAFSSYVFFQPVHVRERGEINFHRIRLPGENDCFF